MLMNKRKVAYAVRMDEIHDSFVESQTRGPIGINPFVDSLDRMTPDDIAPPAPKAKKSTGDKILDTARYVAMGVCAIVFIVCMAYIINSLLEYKKGRDYYNSLSDGLFDEVYVEPNNYFSSVSRLSKSSKSVNLYNYDTFLKNLGTGIPDVAIIDGTRNLQFERMKAKLWELHGENNHIYGWIKIDDTRINYPMVKGEDNDFYLTHAPNGEHLQPGSIFVDYRCGNSLADNLNTVIYGHNELDKSMFNNVDKFIKSEKFFLESKIILYTFDGIYTYEPYSIFRVKSYYPYFRTDFSSHEDFLNFALDMQSKSIWKKDVTLTADDRLITLSTCDNITTDGRYSVHAKLISIER